MAHVDFSVIKAEVSEEQAIEFLGLSMKWDGTQWRSPCPACRKAGDRALAVTPLKGYYCFAPKKGGDVIAFVAHIRGCGQREAAELLQEHFLEGRVTTAERKGTSRTTAESDAPPTDGLQPLDHLTTDHPVIEMLGLSATTCQALGIGFTAKGMMKGRVAFPLRLPDGTLVAYMGLATSPDQAPLLLFPKNLDEKVAAPPKVEEKPKQDAEALRKMFRIVA